jgi:Ca2+-binding RTX toxin-like protein
VLRTFGDGNTKNDRYVYTDEFSRWVNIHGHAPVLGDTDGGIDTVNTAAIGTDTVINLRNGRTSSIDGVTVTTNGNSLENAVTGDGNDEIYGNGLENVLWGMRGNDKLFGFDGRDILRGGSGRDLLNGGTGNDKLLGEQGNDRLIGDAGRDALLGGKGNDYLDGGDDADNLQGYTGNDELYGGNGRDRMDGGADNDKLVGGADRDIMDGGDGRDSLKGQAGNDVMRGGTGRDALDGGSGDDRLGGGRGNDTLKGGTGNDELTGSQGADVFVYMNGWDNDRITDFTDNQDTLHLDQALWGGGLSVAQVIAAYASVVGGDVVFDFGGGDTLRLIGWTTTAGLADERVLI